VRRSLRKYVNLDEEALMVEKMVIDWESE